jgi:aminopeptidase N
MRAICPGALFARKLRFPAWFVRLWTSYHQVTAWAFDPKNGYRPAVTIDSLETIGMSPRFITAALPALLLCCQLLACCSVAGADDDYGYDVQHYDINVDIDIDTETVTGIVSITAKAETAGLNEVVLNLYDEMQVAEVASTTHTIAGMIQSDDKVTITLSESLARDEEFTVTVLYDGTPPDVDGSISSFPFVFWHHGTEEDGTLAPLVYSMSVTNRSSTWWPCKDVIWDKALLDIAITVPDTLTAVSNGVLISRAELENNRATFYWSHGYDVPPYLVSVAISNYTTIVDSAHIEVQGAQETVPLVYYVYPEDEEDAIYDVARLGEALEFYSTVFGPYPYWDEKYGMAFATVNGGMEHQTISTLGSRYLRGDRSAEWVFVHELAHQWCGDWVGIADWRDVWLNESFATYCEAIWFEHVDGEQAYFDQMAAFDNNPPPDHSGFSGTIYDPDPLFGSTPYKKGAWVLHMLRRIMGKENLFQIFENWMSQYGGQDVVLTQDFIDLCEQYNPGYDFQTFFDQWLLYPGRPHYSYQWSVTPGGENYTVTVRVSQTQDQLDVYVMPLDIRIETESGSETFLAANNERDQTFTFDVDAMPTAVTLDPDNWILKPSTIPTSVSSGLNAPRPNPTPGECLLSYYLPQETRVSLKLYDVAGRLVRTFVNQELKAANQTIEWQGRDDNDNPVASGVYYLRLEKLGQSEVKSIVVVR